MSDDHNKAIRKFTGIYTLLTLIITVTTIVATCINGCEVRSSNRNNIQQGNESHIKDSTFLSGMHQEERAYVSVPASGLIFNKDSTYVKVVVNFRNVGRTPAIKVRYQMGILPDTTGIPPPDVPTIDPSANLPFTIFPDQITVDAQQGFIVQRIFWRKHKYNIFIFGNCTYEDIFHQIHFTHFYQRYFFDIQVFKPCGLYNDCN